MGKITHYMVHDPISNTEGILTEFDTELISKAADSGIIFIGVDADGNRSVVAASDVKEPENGDEVLRIVKPAYVDDRVRAVVDVFDALAASVPAVAASADVQPVSSKAWSSMSFAEALEALRALAYGTGEEGGELM